MSEPKVVFVVDVEYLDHVTEEWKPLATGVELKEPVYYDSKKMNEQFEKQHPDLAAKIPTWTDSRKFRFRSAINFKIRKWGEEEL